MSQKLVLEKLRHEASALRLFGTLLRNGTPILTSLNLVSEVFPNLKSTLRSIHDSIVEGGSFTDGLKEGREHFSDLDRLLLSVGEETGNLDRISCTLADMKVRQARLLEHLDPQRVSELADYQALAYMMSAGLPLLRSMRIMAELPSPQRHIYSQVADLIEGGMTMSQAMSAFPGTFPAYIVNMVAAGETGGVLDLALDQIVSYLGWEIFGPEFHFHSSPTAMS